MVHCSVIIPHYNQSEYLLKCLDALFHQEASGLDYEIIVVDNGTDGLTLPSSPLVKFLQNSTERNPYVSRNIGIQAAKGKVFAFLDARCNPSQHWLERGIGALKSCDIAAGSYDVETNIGLRSKVFPLLYLISAKNIEKGYGATAGNLFVKRDVFDALGLFDTFSKSGNDILFTKKAMSNGYKMGFAENAIVQYPPKSFKSLISDMRKYGKGAAITRQKSILSISLYLLPMKWSTLKEAIKYRSFDFSLTQKLKVWLLIWRAKVEFALGVLEGYSSFRTPTSRSRS